MDRLSARLAALSPEKRALLERRLRADDLMQTQAAPVSERNALARTPLSFAQERLWFFEQLEPGHPFYNLPLAVQLTGPISAPALERAINEIVRRHESLRTTFVLDSAGPAQVIAPELRVPLTMLDLRATRERDREAEAARIVADEAILPFDLARGPLIRAKLVRLSPTNHYLLVTMHHIVSDGWSMTVFHRELNALYSAFAFNRPAPLEKLPLQYADFAVWQREYLSGERLERLLAYWRRKLADAPPLLDLPTDHPRPRAQAFEGGAYVMPYPSATVDALKALARKQDATLFMALLAVFDVLLFRFSGITDMIVGAPVANRNRVEHEALIGFFVNTLVLRTDLSGDPTFRDVLARVREVTLEAFAHQDLPFERLVEELQPDRNLSHNPLFQVMFALQNTDAQVAARNAPAQFAFGTSKFDLTLSARETAEGLTVAFEFNGELFELDTVASLARTFGTLIESAARYPDRPISELPLVGGEEREQLVSAAATPGNAPDALLVHGLFEAQAARTPDAVAADFAGTTLTYAELDARANRTARWLRARGARPGVLVGLCMDRCLELVVAMLGVLKAGAAFVPLDPAYPKERLAYMLGDTRTRILLTRARLADALPAFDGEVVPLDTGWDQVAAHPPEPLGETVSPDDLAYVIYTSGSTGRPKGVMVPHRGTCNAAQAQIEAFGLPPRSRVLQFGSLSFDTSVYDLLMAIGCGGALCLAPQDDILPGPPLVATLRSQRINAITIPPSALAVVPHAPLPDLRLIVCGGEQPSRELVARWLPGRRLFNAYGPTETTIWTAVAECTDASVTPPIGRAIANARAHVLDPRMEPVPPGLPGELYIGGPGVARGYLNRPDLSAERFVPDPFASQPGARLYRTGDRVKLLASGEIRFLGRFDHQFKLRGYRIELGEIEAVLLRAPGVGEAAAVTQRSPNGEVRIAASCVAQSGAALDRAALAAHLRGELPEFMVPAVIHIVPALPLTGSGKLDRSRLSVWSDVEPVPGARWIAPRSAIEERVAQIFRDVLEVERVGANDGFFDLGGHSLLATQAIMRINDTFEVALPLRAMFESGTVEALALAVERALGDTGAPAVPAIAKLARRPVAVAAEAQR